MLYSSLYMTFSMVTINLRSPRKLTPKRKHALTFIEGKPNSQRLCLVDYNKPWNLVPVPTEYTLTVCGRQGY